MASGREIRSLREFESVLSSTKIYKLLIYQIRHLKETKVIQF